MLLDGNEARYVWRPQAGPQEALLSCPADEICFGGARGGGKTGGAIGMWLKHAGTYGEAAQGIFFRRRYKDLEGAHIQMSRFFRPLGATWRGQSQSWAFPNGAVLRLRHLWDERDADAFQGHEYTFLVYEEAGQWPTPKPIDMLRGTLRSTAGVKPVLLLTANPGGAGHLWLKARFVTPARRGYHPIRDPETGQVRVFIPSKLEDNPILLRADPYYRRRLQQVGSASLVRAWLNGDWDIVAGGAFDDVWNAERQVLPRDFTPPPSWGWRRAMDWGSARPAAVGIWAISDGTPPEGYEDTHHFPKGSMVLVSELYTVARDDLGEAIPNTGLEWDNARLGREIARVSGGRRFGISVADPSIFTRQGGPSIFEQMAAAARKEGDRFDWVKADNSRIAGWQRLRGLMRASSEARPEAPGLWVAENCTEWLRTVPVAQRDQKNPDDVDTEGEDHHADQTRYAAMASEARTGAVGPIVVR